MNLNPVYPKQWPGGYPRRPWLVEHMSDTMGVHDWIVHSRFSNRQNARDTADVLFNRARNEGMPDDYKVRVRFMERYEANPVYEKTWERPGEPAFSKGDRVSVLMMPYYQKEWIQCEGIVTNRIYTDMGKGLVSIYYIYFDQTDDCEGGEATATEDFLTHPKITIDEVKSNLENEVDVEANEQAAIAWSSVMDNHREKYGDNAVIIAHFGESTAVDGDLITDSTSRYTEGLVETRDGGRVPSSEEHVDVEVVASNVAYSMAKRYELREEVAEVSVVNILTKAILEKDQKYIATSVSGDTEVWAPPDKVKEKDLA